MSKQYVRLTVDKHTLMIVDAAIQVGPAICNLVTYSCYQDFVIPVDVKASGVYLEVGDVGK